MTFFLTPVFEGDVFNSGGSVYSARDFWENMRGTHSSISIAAPRLLAGLNVINGATGRF